MHLGIIGSRKGITEKQELALSSLVQKIDWVQLHYGGVDKRVVLRYAPSSNERLSYKDETFNQKQRDYLYIVKSLVDNSGTIIAYPDSNNPMPSATWYGIQYAKKVGKPIYIINTKGNVRYISRKLDLCD